MKINYRIITYAQSMSILEIISIMVAGVGLFFGGLKVLTNSLKDLATHNFRLLVARWTGNPFLSAFWGVVSGAVCQSSFSSVYILIGLVRSGILTVRKALPILSWTNVGITLLIFVVAIDLKIGIFIFVGVSGFLFGLHKENRWENLFTAFFGFSLLLMGYQVLKSGSQPFAQMEVIKNMFEFGKNSYIIPVLIGFILRLLIHSSPTVAVLIMSFSHAGLIGLDQVILIIFSLGFGEALTTRILSSGTRGISKQLVIFRVLESLLSSFILILISYIEILWNIPLVNHLIRFIATDIEQQTAFTFLIAKITPLLLLSFFYNPIYKLLQRLSPPTPEEGLSVTRFITEQSLSDFSTALILIEYEQVRIFERFAESIDNVRNENTNEFTSDFAVIRKSNMVLINEIDMYLTRIGNFNLSHDNSEYYIQLQNRQLILKSIDETVFNFVSTIHVHEFSMVLDTLVLNSSESLHVNFITAVETTKSKNFSEIEMLLKITSDKGSLMEKTRKFYFSENQNLSQEDKAALLYITALFERTVWLLNSWARSITPDAEE